MLMFERKILKCINGLLWVTFSSRNDQVNQKQVENLIPKMAKKFQYNLKLVEKGSYGIVYYFMFKTF